MASLLYVDYMILRVKTVLPPEDLKYPLTGNFSDEDMVEGAMVEESPPDVSTEGTLAVCTI